MFEIPRPAAALARRRFLTVAGAATALAFTVDYRGRPEARAGGAALREDPFTLGIASGDPLPDSVVIWTRLAPKPFEPLSGMDRRDASVEWQVATDERFRHVVRSGVATARYEYGHSVHVDVRGLKPGRQYYYRFRAGRWQSEVGRTRTAPAGPSSGLTFAFASCQYWGDGYYTAHRHLAAEDPDVVLFLGDYIYEYGIAAAGGLRNVSTPVPSQFRTETDTLDRYRLQYALYKSDPDLREAHRVAPWIVTWDDHEVQDNYAGLVSKTNAPVEDFLVRRANAYRAYWENLPLRTPQPQGPDMRLHRRFGYGDLADFTVLDTRQFRSDQAQGDGWDPDSPARRDPARTLLGDAQEQWFLDGLRDSQATWNIVASQVVMSQMDLDPTAGQLFNMDGWDGYQAQQDRALAGLATRPNPVVVTGDVHSSYAFDLKRDVAGPTIGVELVGTSISSAGNGMDISPMGQKFLDSNPHLKLVNERRGYVVCRLTGSELRADFRILPYVDRPGAPVSTHRSFVVEAGNPGLNPA
ncbi:alkaline phosphatase D family protein [Phytohabitans rumicis]|uniref:Alkaline phosphatase n=1 Tax=Phytohabitans rumicis TaxID=1076125 RepID=A0A6V8L5Y5_9ACTN|nr:alkaline phosphatase D family protein [Phytohabitans rumicis]GFJ89516.1 alkaline phosphatase [Phytohabitans rumicis]